MIGTERLFPDRQRALVERLGFGIATLRRRKAPPDCSAIRDIRMIGTKHFFSDRQRALIERLGIGIATLLIELKCLLIKLRRLFNALRKRYV